MKYVAIFMFLLLAACKTNKTKKAVGLADIVKGNWFVLYPKDSAFSAEQDKVYGEIQDSLINLKCQKLLTFSDDGSFQQLDSTNKKGTWAVKGNEWLYINNGGNGFDNFKTTFHSNRDGVLKLSEEMTLQNVPLKFVWHLLKIDTGQATQLFGKKENEWRMRPMQTQTDAQIKNRLVSMLQYYSYYFTLISDKASYFVPARVVLPIKLYQHAIGLKEKSEIATFNNYFFDKVNADKAYSILGKGLEEADFESISDTKSYTKEYAAMFLRVAEVLSEK